MELPVIGYISVPDIALALFLLAMFLFGLFRCIGHELGWLLPAVLAAAFSLHPAIHSQGCNLLSFLSPALAHAVAYAAAYYLGMTILRVLLSLIRPLREMNPRGAASGLLGGLGALSRGFMDCTMFLILASAWPIPWDALFRQSRLADFMVDLWHKFGLLTELYATYSAAKFLPL